MRICAFYMVFLKAQSCLLFLYNLNSATVTKFINIGPFTSPSEGFNGFLLPSPLEQTAIQERAIEMPVVPQGDSKKYEETPIAYVPTGWDILSGIQNLYHAANSKNDTLDSLMSYSPSNIMNMASGGYSNYLSPVLGFLAEREKNYPDGGIPIKYLNNGYVFKMGGKKGTTLPNFTKFTAQVNNRNIITDRGSDETTQSNDATWVDSGKKMLYDHKSKRVMDVSRRQNPELRKRGIEGGRKHSEWEKKHPVLNGIETLMGAAPLAIATAPMATVAGDAVAGTALGHAVTGGLTGLNTLTANSTWFPWVNAAVDGYFLADATDNIRKGNITPETVLELAPVIGVGKGIAKGAAKGIQKAQYLSGKYMPSNIKNFTKGKSNPYSSMLDWTPENWFGTRIKGLYDAEDAAALSSHVPEYRTIEREAKKNGTWLQMPDGSTWKGDPRSWVQMQSKDYKNAKLKDSPVYTGSRYGDIATYQGELWTSNNKNIARSYSKNTYELTYPKDINIKSYDAEGRHWGDVFGDDSYDTNAIVHENLYDKPNIDAVEINNVIDPGAGMRGMPIETQIDLLNTPYTDLVLKPGVPRKSLHGNNGNFNLSKHNIYKVLLPFGLMTPFYNKTNE